MAPKRAPRRTVRPRGFAAIDPDTIPEPLQPATDVGHKILSTFDTSRNELNPANLFHHMISQDPADFGRLQAAIAKARAARPSLHGYNFASVPVKHDSLWVLQLIVRSYRGPDGETSYDPIPGGQPLYHIGIHDGTSEYPLTEPLDEPGAPAPAVVLTWLKQAIAAPMIPPFEPGLPGLLVLARSVSAYVPNLRPFLDALPAPFAWRLETQEEASAFAAFVAENHRTSLCTGRAEKALGDEAVTRKDRAGAVKHYSKAIVALKNAWAVHPSAEQMASRRLMSVCHANRAAAYLMPGEGQDAMKALRDGEEAFYLDELYAKAYYRQAKAYQLLDAPCEAIEILVAALQKPGLAQDNGLIDTLVECYGGFPNTEAEMRIFCAFIFSSDDGDKRTRDLEGFRRRTEEHLMKIIGPNASLATL